MNVNWKHFAAALGVLPFVGVLGASIGFFDVSASSGHWKVTDWFLHFAMRSSVRTYALNVDVPGNLPRNSIQSAAGHFARGCAICHGAPGEPRPSVVNFMLPQPPDLATRSGNWTDAQLFRIVKHGVKFTGMPAWPTQKRDDEVWAMVAFLRELPALDQKRWRDLAYGELSPAVGQSANFQQVLSDCVRCHGKDGAGRSLMTPILSGQNKVYLVESLRAYAAKLRPSGIMETAATAVNPEFFEQLAQYYSIQPIQRASGTRDPELVKHGERIANHGDRDRDIPACLGCHGRRDRNQVFPELSSQSAEYLTGQLKLFRAGVRGGTPFEHLMRNAAKRLTDDEIAALAAYFAHRPRSASPEPMAK